MPQEKISAETHARLALASFLQEDGMSPLTLVDSQYSEQALAPGDIVTVTLAGLGKSEAISRSVELDEYSVELSIREEDRDKSLDMLESKYIKVAGMALRHEIDNELYKALMDNSQDAGLFENWEDSLLECCTKLDLARCYRENRYILGATKCARAGKEVFGMPVFLGHVFDTGAFVFGRDAIVFVNRPYHNSKSSCSDLGEVEDVSVVSFEGTAIRVVLFTNEEGEQRIQYSILGGIAIMEPQWIWRTDFDKKKFRSNQILERFEGSSKFQELAQCIEDNTDSREKSLALTNLEEAYMWAQRIK